MTTRVVNKYKEEYDEYIGRGSKWGNPFSHLDGTKATYKVNSRDDAVKQYAKHLWKQMKSGEVTKEDLLSLDGKRLGCFCKPKACHGDVIVKAIDWIKESKDNDRKFI